MQDSVIAAIKVVTEQDVTLDTELNDVMDSLERASLAVELLDPFPDVDLVEDEAFFKAVTVADLIKVIENCNASK